MQNLSRRLFTTISSEFRFVLDCLFIYFFVGRKSMFYLRMCKTIEHPANVIIPKLVKILNLKVINWRRLKVNAVYFKSKYLPNHE